MGGMRTPNDAAELLKRIRAKRMVDFEDVEIIIDDTVPEGQMHLDVGDTTIVFRAEDRSLRTALTRARNGATRRGGSEDGKGKTI